MQGTVELAYGTPFLLSLHLSKSLLALVWLAGPLSGLVIHPLVGFYSDNCTSRFGKRRPFIVLSSVFVVLSLVMISYSPDLASFIAKWSVVPYSSEKIENYTIVFAVSGFYFLDFSINAVQASVRALIVDVAPPYQQESANAWAGRMIGLGNVLGYFMGFIDLPSNFTLFGSTQIKCLCGMAITLFVLFITITCISVTEKVNDCININNNRNESWLAPLFEIFNSIRYLPQPLKQVCNVQFFSWIGWFPFLFYSTAWVASTGESVGLTVEGTRIGSLSLLLFALISVITGFTLPLITTRSDIPQRHKTFQEKWTSLPYIWIMSLWFFACIMSLTYFVSTQSQAVAIIALCGIPWGVTQWVPFTLIGEFSANETVDVEADDSSDMTEYELFSASAGMILGIHNIYIVVPQLLSTILCALMFQLMDEKDGFGMVLRIGAISSIFASWYGFKVTEGKRKRRI